MTTGSAYGRMVGPPLPAGMSHGGAQIAKDALDELFPRRLGVDLGTRDDWTVMEYSVDADGNLLVRHVSQGKFYDLDSGNQYTGGQDF